MLQYISACLVIKTSNSEVIFVLVSNSFLFSIQDDIHEQIFV